MIRKNFDVQLNSLQDQVVGLGKLVETALGEAIRTLEQCNSAAAPPVDGRSDGRSDGLSIETKREAIKDKTLSLIATQQPVACDLRVLVGILQIITELEQMSRYAKDIANANQIIREGFLRQVLFDIVDMASKARHMLRAALMAFIERDIEAAESIVAADDEVDRLYTQVSQELLAFAKIHPYYSPQATCLLRIAHNLERTADRATNICQRVVFTINGQIPSR